MEEIGKFLTRLVIGLWLCLGIAYLMDWLGII